MDPMRNEHKGWRALAGIMFVMVADAPTVTAFAKHLREVCDAVPDDAGMVVGCDLATLRACASKLEAWAHLPQGQLAPLRRVILDAIEEVGLARVAAADVRSQELAETEEQVEPGAFVDEVDEWANDDAVHDPGDEHDPAVPAEEHAA